MAPSALAWRSSRLGLGDHRRVPELRILPAERHEGALGVAAGRPARLGVQHQGEEAERLGRVGQQPGDEAGEEDRLAGQLAAGGVGAAGSVQPSAKAA